MRRRNRSAAREPRANVDQHLTGPHLVGGGPVTVRGAVSMLRSLASAIEGAEEGLMGIGWTDGDAGTADKDVDEAILSAQSILEGFSTRVAYVAQQLEALDK